MRANERQQRTEDMKDAIIDAIKYLAIACDCYEQVRGLPYCKNCGKQLTCAGAKDAERWKHINCRAYQEISF